MSRTVSRVMSSDDHLSRSDCCRQAQATYPKARTGHLIVSDSVLLRMGFTCALSVTSQAVVSYTAFPPLPAKAGGLFLLHFPGSHLHRTLSGILPCEARTFLTCCLSALQPRSSVLLTLYNITLFFRFVKH